MRRLHSMCKLFVMTNTKKIKKIKLEQITKSVSKVIQKSERDGLGISIQGNKGIYVRRFLNPLEASIFEPLTSLPFLKSDSSQSGELDSIDSIVIHGRTSTNKSGLKNCHPIARNGFILSHNGVVEDSGPKYEMMTDNDTEHVVERFSQGIKEVESHISGYYAFASYKEGTDSLYICRDNIASLYFAEIKSLDCHIFATTQEIISECLKTLELKSISIKEVQDNILLEYRSGQFYDMTEITPKGRTAYSDSLASLSLGYEIASTIGNQNNDWNLENKNDLYSAEDNFFYEVESCADDTWVYFLDGLPLNCRDFLDLDYGDQLKCLVIRADGTICSANDDNGLMFEGRAI